MSNKVFVGRKAATLSVPPAFDPISKIVILVDSKNVYEAGDDTGLALELPCPYGTQALADNLLAQHKGFTYQPLEAVDALMDPAAELGDGITIAGEYTMLAEQKLEFDSLLASTVKAPGQKELESEYPFQTQEQQLERKIARTRSLITKTAEQIRLEVSESLNGLSSSITVELDKITQTVTGLDGKYTSLQTTVDGVTVTDQSGTSRIKGSSIETDSLYVNAANITGTLTADQVVLSGSITWNDLSSGVQSTINGAYAAGLDEDDVTTLITSTLVSSPTIAGGQFKDLDQTNWLEMGRSTTGNIGYLYHYYGDYSDSEPVCAMGYYGTPGFRDSWVLAPFRYVILEYSDTVGKVACYGTWDFSQANVIGLPTSS